MDSGVFRARTIREALKKVRAEFGAEAMIVSQHRRDGWIEVTARRDDGVSPAAKRVVAAPQEITGGRAREKLAAMGLDPGLIDTAFASAPAKRWADLERAVKQLLPAAPRPVTLSRGRVRLIGPAGAGRTTNLIRLATNHVLQHGNRSMALVTTDTARLAGAEALMLAGELLGVPVLEASSDDELRNVLATLSERALILLDTPALPSRGGDEIAELPSFETFLVLPVTHRLGVMKALLERTAKLQPAGVVLTQLDCSEGIADVLSLLWRHAMGVAWLAAGSDLDAGLEPATSELLWRLAAGTEVSADVDHPSPATPRARVRELAIA